MKIICFLLLIVAALGSTGCDNPFSLDREMDEFTDVMTETAGIIASNPVVLPP
ncbi:MAG: hypothetical protein PHD82_17220 [Candidatus Riflebacteria bacterium]|nr:hypothetical protein [Candidatus Riflebacteria bacterium]